MTVPITNTVIPNTFQTPNGYVDRAMELLSGTEFKCLVLGVRHILGWRDTIITRKRPISLTMFEKGFDDSKGNHYGGTGLTRMAIMKAVAGLVEYKFFVEGNLTIDGQEYELGESPDWNGLEARSAAQLDSNKQRTSKARSTPKSPQVVSPTDQHPGQSDTPAAVSPTHQQRLVRQTGAVVSRTNGIKPTGHQTKEQTHTQTLARARKPVKSRVVNDYDDVPKDDRLQIIRAWAENLTAYSSRAFKADANHSAAADIFRDGYRPLQVALFVKAKMNDDYWHGKTLTLAKVAELLPAWVLNQKPTAVPAPTKPRTRRPHPLDNVDISGILPTPIAGIGGKS